MCHDKGGAPRRQAFHRVLDRAFAFGIQRACRLVQKQDGGVAQDGTGDGDALLLPPRQHDAAFADESIVPLRQGRQKLMRGGGPGGRLHLGVGGIGAAEPDVFTGRPRKDHRILRHQRDGSPEIVPAHRFQVKPVYGHPPLLGVVEAQKQLQDRGLAGTGRPDKGHRLARCHHQINAVQRRGFRAGRIAENNVFKADLAPNRAGQGDRAGGVNDRVIGCQKLLQALCRPGGALQLSPDF